MVKKANALERVLLRQLDSLDATDIQAEELWDLRRLAIAVLINAVRDTHRPLLPEGPFDRGSAAALKAEIKREAVEFFKVHRMHYAVADLLCMERDFMDYLMSAILPWYGAWRWGAYGSAENWQRARRWRLTRAVTQEVTHGRPHAKAKGVRQAVSG